MTHTHDARGHDQNGRDQGPGHENPWAGQGAVMLDIGEDVGALVVEMPASTIGLEVEICLAGTAKDGSVHHEHVAVVDRVSEEGHVPSLVYPSLTEGTYELFEKGTTRVELVASVIGGQVTEVSWPAAQDAVPRQRSPRDR